MKNDKKQDDDKWVGLKPTDDKSTHDKSTVDDKSTHHKSGDDTWHHHKPGDGDAGDGDAGDGGFGEGKKVVLSFDDGPAPVEALKDILKTLHHEDIKS